MKDFNLRGVANHIFLDYKYFFSLYKCTHPEKYVKVQRTLKTVKKQECNNGHFTYSVNANSKLHFNRALDNCHLGCLPSVCNLLLKKPEKKWRLKKLLSLLGSAKQQQITLPMSRLVHRTESVLH